MRYLLQLLSILHITLSESCSNADDFPSALTWPLNNSGQRGLRVIVSEQNDTMKYHGVLKGRYNGDNSTLLGKWYVSCSLVEREHKLVNENDILIKLVKGLQVIDKTTTHETIIKSVNITTKTVLTTLSEKYISPTTLNQLTKEVYELGDRVEVTDSLKASWREGRVTGLSPLTVAVTRWKKSHQWRYTRHLQFNNLNVIKRTFSPLIEAFDIHDHVRVRDSLSSPWQHAQIVSIQNDGTVMARVHGWRTSRRWNFMELLQSDPRQVTTSAPIPQHKNKIHEVWSAACRNATCPLGVVGCKDEYVCGNTSGCTYTSSELENCKIGLKVGDSVSLSDNGPQSGSMQPTEVGVIIEIFKDEQPYLVRGGYGDAFRYRDYEIIPAWGKDITWVPKEYRNSVLNIWKGYASFGQDAESVQGASINEGFKNTDPDDEWDELPQTLPPVTPPSVLLVPLSRVNKLNPVPELPVETLPPIAEVTSGPAVEKSPVVEVPTTAIAATPSALPAVQIPVETPLPVRAIPVEIIPQPPPATPIPPLATPKPPLATPKPPSETTPSFTFAPGRRPKLKVMPPKKLVKQPSAPVLHVYIPEKPSLCGTYELQKKSFRENPFYISTDCPTRECVIFMSHGQFWMIGQNAGDPGGNRGIVKSVEKIVGKSKKKQPYEILDWDCMEAGKWVRASGLAARPDDMLQHKIAKNYKTCGR